MVPHAPQLLLSEVVSTQFPEQSVWEPGQDTRQLLLEQTSPVLHWVPQALQLLRSLFRLTQTPAQRLRPEGQVQEPLTQV